MGAAMSRPLFLAVAVAYPAYRTFKALESAPSTSADPEAVAASQAQQRHWLTYWVVQGAFQMASYAGDGALQWLPLYTLLKLAASVWLIHPKTRGSAWVYDAVIKPYLLRHQDRIDDALDKGSEWATEKATSLKQNGMQLAATHGQTAVRKASEYGVGLLEYLRQAHQQTQQQGHGSGASAAAGAAGKAAPRAPPASAPAAATR